jgi:hypothetical protein
LGQYGKSAEIRGRLSLAAGTAVGLAEFHFHHLLRA